jgi:hypothetical protein
MKMVKERTRIISAANDERRQVLFSKVIWDRTKGVRDPLYTKILVY